MTKPSPTPEQQAILSAARDTQENLCIRAYAGCGKTSTLEMLAGVVKAERPAALAFNVKIKAELEKRFPKSFTILTLNGLGHRAWSDNIGKRCEVDAQKLGKLVTQICKAHGFHASSEDWDTIRRLVALAMNAGLVPKAFPLYTTNAILEDTPENWADLMEEEWGEVDPRLIALAQEVLVADIKLAFAGKISYDDQIYCSALLGGRFPKFDLVLVDEAQDLSPLNREQVRKCASGRIILCGDAKQCHPPGTAIRLTGGISKNIEDVVVGDRLVSYNRKVGFSGINTQGTPVLDKAEFDFEGRLVEIKAGASFDHLCTPNHKCMVRWTGKDKWTVYLMRKGNQYRIGSAQAWYSTGERGAFGPAMRARQEKADAVWILSVHDSKEEALIEEKIIWSIFGLPDLIFRCSGKASSTQAHLDIAWTSIGDNSLRGEACLQQYGRDVYFPIWKAGDKTHIGEKTFITQACNLVSDAMSVKIFDGTPNGVWLPIFIERSYYKGKVYGLTVGGNGYGLNLYTANDIVTHNSIYAFRGADHNSIDNLKSLRASWLELPLTITFRCPQEIVARQQDHAPGFTAFATAPKGEVVALPLPPDGIAPQEPLPWCWEQVQAVAKRGPVTVLCRNVAPLMSLAFKLLRRSIGVQMVGRDIGKGLQTLSKKILPDDTMPWPDCAAAINDWLARESALAKANKKEHLLEGLEDKAACLLAVGEAGCHTALDLRRKIELLFSREDGIVTLSTIHRAKGLEWPTVLHLDPWRIPSRYAQSEAALTQEANLQYVAETRVQRTLIIASLEDFV